MNRRIKKKLRKRRSYFGWEYATEPHEAQRHGKTYYCEYMDLHKNADHYKPHPWKVGANILF